VQAHSPIEQRGEGHSRNTKRYTSDDARSASGGERNREGWNLLRKDGSISAKGNAHGPLGRSIPLQGREKETLRITKRLPDVKKRHWTLTQGKRKEAGIVSGECSSRSKIRGGGKGKKNMEDGE